MRESETEAEIRTWAEKKDGEAVRLKIDGERGFPDMTLFFPNAFILFTETKTKHGKTSPHQNRWIAKLRRWGFTVEVVRSLDEAKAAYKKAADAKRILKTCS